MIIFRSIICFLLLVTVSMAQSQTVKTPVKKITSKPKAAIALKPSGKTLLWQVSGNDLKQPSYLFGTMHVLCAEDAKLSAGLKDVIKNSIKVYFEIDMDDMAEMMGAMKYLRMNDGVKISDLLTKEEFARLEDYFKKNASVMPMSMINRFKPFLVSGLLSEQNMGCKKKNGMEEIIMKEAKVNDKQIFGLETVQFQASLFDSIPYDRQAKELVKYIDSMDTYQKSTLAMVDIYRKQDLDKMDSLVSKSDPGMADYMDLLLYSRNRRWVQQVPTIMREGTVLFAVGAGHLPGEQGVINLLRKKGYTVKPVAN